MGTPKYSKAIGGPIAENRACATPWKWGGRAGPHLEPYGLVLMVLEGVLHGTKEES